MKRSKQSWAWSTVALIGVVALGCSPASDSGGRSAMDAMADSYDRQEQDEQAAAAAASPEEQPGATARRAAEDTASDGAESANPQRAQAAPRRSEARDVTARDPERGRVFHNQPGYLNAVFSARFTAENQMTFNKVKHAVDLFQATHGHKPESHEEFMREIIEANYIELPELRDNYEYWYDAEDGVLKMRKPVAEGEAGGGDGGAEVSSAPAGGGTLDDVRGRLRP